MIGASVSGATNVLVSVAAVTSSVSLLVGAVNALLNNVIHKRAKATEQKLGAVENQLNHHDERVSRIYQDAAQVNRELLAYLQGLNQPVPGGQ